MRKAPEPVRSWTWPHYYLIGGGLKLLMKLLGGYRVYGKEKVPKKGGALLCANHISYLDPPAVGGAVHPRRAYYFAKQELFRNPIFGAIIHSCYAFPVDREGTDREAIRYAIELLEKGELLVLFPEGGRSPDGTLQPGNLGPALMASKAGVPIIPAAVKGTDVQMPPGKGGLHRGRVQVDFGDPIDPRSFGEGRLRRDQLEALTEALMAAIYKLQQTQYEREGQVAPPRRES